MANTWTQHRSMITQTTRFFADVRPLDSKIEIRPCGPNLTDTDGFKTHGLRLDSRK